MVLSLRTQMLHADSTKACFGQNWAAWNSPSWFSSGWHGRPARVPNFASSASPSTVTGAPQFVC